MFFGEVARREPVLVPTEFWRLALACRPRQVVVIDPKRWRACGLRESESQPGHLAALRQGPPSVSRWITFRAVER